VRIRLAVAVGDASKAWGQGTQKGVSPLPTGIDTSYAWFGLVNRGGQLPDRTAIKAAGAVAGSEEGRRVLHLAFPDGEKARMEEVIGLIGAFGLLGSRSRGGWGALHVEGIEPLDANTMGRYARPIEECLRDDWAMSLASDDKGLCVWESKRTWRAWHEAFRVVASERRGVRSALKGLRGRDLRAALGFASPGRMPSPVRWKLVEREQGLAIRVIAMPHALPRESGRAIAEGDLNEAWKTVRGKLDGSVHLARV
jgi:CRISPR-associated protein Cmr1